ncbi:MAG: prepilin-type N-terminal cleavage/methylation domain-containing protein [Phycisphaerae bacterium]|nr:prepilin-type N-terminal cleavage/methylation domain-containing protein [Phycisphaerae bacterium]
MATTIAIAGRSRRAGSAGRPGHSSRKPRHGGGRLGDRSAFTLVEVILVVILMGVLAAVAIPRFAGSALWGLEGEGSVRSVVATLHLARRMAIDRAATRPNGFYVVCSGASYYIYSPDTGAVEGETKTLFDGWTFAKGYKLGFNSLGAETGLAGTDTVNIVGHGTTWLISVSGPTGSVKYVKGT